MVDCTLKMEYNGAMIIKCHQCGTETNKSPYYIKKFNGRLFCSKKCYYDSLRKDKIKRICEVCKIEFQSHVSSVKYHGARFCSKECKDIFNRSTNSYSWKGRANRICKSCGKEFEIEYWRLNDIGRGQYCSRQCKVKDMLEHPRVIYHSKNSTLEELNARNRQAVSRWRKACLLRDDYKCIQCGNTDDLEVDHIKPFAIFVELRAELSNGRTLCHKCHKQTPTFAKTFKQLQSMNQDDMI
jgi:endogenous inhibitor of DNA gyrase (YacG/DUF329 family)